MIAHGVEHIGMDEETEKAFHTLREVMFERLYRNVDVKGEETKAISLLQDLFTFHKEHPEKMPEEYQDTIEQEGIDRACADYVAGMTDNFAMECYQSIFIPKCWNFK